MDRRILVASGLLDALHVGVVLTDSRGRPLRANAAAQRLLGCQPDGSPVSEQVLAIAREALRSGTAREQEPMLGQTALRVRATPIEGGAVVELDDVSLARRTQHAYRELLAAVGATLLDRVEPLGLLVEALTAADDPEHATRVFRQLGEEANALVDLIGSATASEGHERAPEPDRAGPDLDPAPPITGSRPFSVDQPIVLLVHPADGLVEALTTGLSQADLSTIAAKDVHQALQTLETMQPDAVVLHCPQGNLTAADAYAKVRAVTNAPVVLLVGGNEPLAAELTDGSAHEVLVLRRPLRLPELVAALHTVMSPPAPAGSLGSLGSLGSEVLAVGDVILDERAHAVKVRGELINMPGKEYEVLRVLLGFAGQAISRERIIELVWGTDIGRGRRNLHTHVKRLRHRIERDPANPEYIITIHGYGWRFAAPSNNNETA